MAAFYRCGRGLSGRPRHCHNGVLVCPARTALLNKLMDSFLPDSVKAILLGFVAVVFVLSRLSYRFPDVDWLQHFRLPIPHFSEEQKRRQRRRASLMAGMEIILAGMVLPLVYVAAKVMMFNEPTTLGMAIVGGCSVACIILGIWVIVRNFRQTQ